MGPVRRRRRRILLAVALLLLATCGVATWRFVLRPAEVTGAQEVRQERVEDAFDRAFEESTAPPPPRAKGSAAADASTLDAGAGFGDDAGTAGGR